jgi:hypothetical protein
MERKYFQIKMDPAAHKRMKIRAGQLNMTIGQYLENVISSFELRLKRAYKIARADALIGLLDDRLLAAVLRGDKEGWDETKLKNELIQIEIDAREENLAFNPHITIDYAK